MNQATGASPLDNFRHFEEGPIRFWCVRECLFMGQRLAQALADIVAAGVSETRSTLFGFVYTVAIQGLGQGRNVRSVELVQSIDVVENRVQVTHHASTLFVCQFQVRQIGYVNNVLFGYFHLSRTFAGRYKLNSLYTLSRIPVDEHQIL